MDLTGYSFKYMEDPNNPGNNHPDCVRMTCPDGSVGVVPMDSKNKDYQIYQEWLSQGNTTVAYDA